MSFADLEAGAVRAPRKGQSPDATRALVFQITTAVASYRRLLNSLGTPKDTPALREHLQKTSHNILQLAKDAKEKLRRAAEADKSADTSADKRVADMKLAKDFATTMEEYGKLQNLAIQREMAYKPIVPQTSQPKAVNFAVFLMASFSDTVSLKTKAILQVIEARNLVKWLNSMSYSQNQRGKRCCNWIMKLFSMRLSLRKGGRLFKIFNNRLVKYMKRLRILLLLCICKELQSRKSIQTLRILQQQPEKQRQKWRKHPRLRNRIHHCFAFFW